mgnify:CR=1 FL=1
MLRRSPPRRRVRRPSSGSSDTRLRHVPTAKSITSRKTANQPTKTLAQLPQHEHEVGPLLRPPQPGDGLPVCASAHSSRAPRQQERHDVLLGGLELVALDGTRRIDVLGAYPGALADECAAPDAFVLDEHVEAFSLRLGRESRGRSARRGRSPPGR